MAELQSWGRFPRAKGQRRCVLPWRTSPLPLPEGATLLPYGRGRSYGDSCLNAGGALLSTEALDRFISFDPSTGILACEAGVTLEDILRLVTWQGWFLPVTPGTKFVTVGGALANDVHGKNHHRAGTFGRHVLRFELLRSDGQRLVCSPTENADWFRATVGGLGLTGLVVWVEVQLRRISNPYILHETIPFRSLEEFFQLSRSADADFEYTVSWVDCVRTGKTLGRGLFYRGNHAPPQFDAVPLARSHLSRRLGLAVPFDLPRWVLNPLSIRAFNFLNYHRQPQRPSLRLVHYDPFFYPLDAIRDWNRVYGQRGLLQFQCVVPFDEGDGPLREILEEIGHSGLASFLAVLKTFGELPSPGMMSFPRKGVTLAVDFANAGKKTYALFGRLDALTRNLGGAQYPAKDALMSPEGFASYFPQRDAFARYIDPAFSSSFWRRVTGTVATQP